MSKSPDNIQIIKTDQILLYLTQFVCVFFPAAVLIALYMHYPFNQISSDMFVDIILLPPLTLIPVLYIYYRSNWIKKLFISGVNVEADVIRMDSSVRPWFFIQYQYEYEHKVYKRLVVLMYNECTKRVVNKKIVTAVVDPVSKKAYIRDAF